MKTPWSFTDEDVPDDVRSADASSGGSRRWLVFGLLCWGFVIVGSALIYTAGVSVPGTPRAAQTQTPAADVSLTSDRAQVLLPIGGKQFGATVRFKSTVSAELVIADRRIPLDLPLE